MLSLHRITALDTSAFHWFQTHRRMYRQIADLSRWVSSLGDGLLYALLGAGLALLEPNAGELFLFVGLLAFLIELPLYLLLKNIIRRNRPCGFVVSDAVIQPSDRFSFPSGHSAAAFVFATLIATYYPMFGELAYFMAMLIGLSRILLGVHYPSDIAAGAVLGILSAELAMQEWATFLVLL